MLKQGLIFSRLHLAAVSLCILFSVSVSVADAVTGAGVDELEKLSIEELLQVEVLKVYGASRYEQKALEAPANVTVITADTIRQFGYRTLAEVLQGTTGLYVSNDRNYQYLGYRGFSRPGDYNTRVLVMIDGVRLNDAVFHQAPIGFDFPLDLRLVERIEVIRGPSQAIYGNNAFLLVVNVLTRPIPQTRQFEADLYQDTRVLTMGGISGGGTLPNGTGLLLSGSLFHTPGSNLYFPAYDDPATNNGNAQHADYANGGSLFMKAQHGRLSLLGGYLSSRKGIPTAAWGSTFNDNSTRTIDERYFGDLSCQLISGATADLKLRGYLNAYNYSGYYAPQYHDYSRALTVGSELVGHVRLPWRNTLVAGVDYRYGAIVRQGDNDGYYDNRNGSNVGLFAQNEFRLLDNLLLMAGLRYDQFAGNLSSLNPKAAVVYLPYQGLALKYLFGTSFRSPNAYEAQYQGSSYRINPSLKEETLYSHELVLEYQYEERLRLVLSGFQYDYRDMISQTVDSNGLFVYENSERYRTRGVETELSYRGRGWSALLGHTYQHTYGLLGSAHATVNSPRNLMKLRLSRELAGPRLVLTGELLYRSAVQTLDPAVTIGEATIVNLTLSSRDLIAKGLDASVSIHNLLDRRDYHPGAAEHLPIAQIPQDGLTVAARLTYRF